MFFLASFFACAGRLPPQDAGSGSTPESLTAECEGHLREERLEAAEGCCRELLSLEPAAGRALLLCGVVEQLRGRPEAALELLERSVKLDASAEAWERYLSLRHALAAELRATVLRLEQAGDFEPAARLLATVPERGAALDCELGELWLRAGESARAEEAFTLASRGALPEPCGLRGQGLAAVAAGRAEEARRISQRLEELGLPPLPLQGPRPAADQLDAVKELGAMTRAELALLLVRMGPSADRSRPVPLPALADVDGHPLQEAIAEVLARGWMRPTEDGLFCPERIVGRLELGAILAPMLGGPEASARPAAAAPAWRQAFPELERLWDLPPYRDLGAPAELLDPASGAEATELVLRLWHPELLHAPKGSR